MAKYLFLGYAFLVCEMRRPNSTSPNLVRSLLSSHLPHHERCPVHWMNTQINFASTPLNLLLFTSMKLIHSTNGVWASFCSQALIISNFTPLWHMILTPTMYQTRSFAMLPFIGTYQHWLRSRAYENPFATSTKRPRFLKLTTIDRSRAGIISQGTGALYVLSTIRRLSLMVLQFFVTCTSWNLLF